MHTTDVVIIHEWDTFEVRGPDQGAIVHHVMYRAGTRRPRTIRIDRADWTPELEREAIRRDIEQHPPVEQRQLVL